jgi:hypothetical protein
MALASLEQTFQRLPDDRRDLRCSDDLRRENSNVTLAFEPRAKLRLLTLKSLDAFEQIAGSVTLCAPIGGME